MLQDASPIALPALCFEYSRSGAIDFGGYPRLPEGYDWPTSTTGAPLHYVLSIDLESVPQGMTQKGQDFDMPVVPHSGKLFIFMALNEDMIFHQPPVVVHAPEADDETPKRLPEAKLPILDPDDACVFHPEYVADDGCSLLRGRMAAHPFLTARAQNPLLVQIGREELNEDTIYASDLAYAQKLHELGITHPLPKPVVAATKEPFFHDIPDTFIGFFERGVFQFEWRYIFEVAQQSALACQHLPIEELENWIHHGDDQPRYRKLIQKFKDQADAISAIKFTDRPGLWDRIACDHVPALTMRLDVQLYRWMNYARIMRDKAEMTQTDKIAFVEMLKLVERKAKAGGKVDLKVLRQFRDNKVRNDFVRKDMSAAFAHTAQALQSLHATPEATLQDKDLNAEVDLCTLQMFGAGQCLQSAAIDHADKVLLLQMSDACGVYLEDGIMQMWVTADDLAAGRFENVVTTLEST